MADANHITQQCESDSGRVRLALTQDGTLLIDVNGKWKPLDFNGMYAGYYPACTFTAIAHAGGAFIAACLDANLQPRAYESLMGGVWKEIDLTYIRTVNGIVQARNRINHICSDANTRQVFMLCNGGDVITLPGCPKCIKLENVAGEDITGGFVSGGKLIITLNSGNKEIDLNAVLQLRVSPEDARRRIAQGALLVDVGEEGQYPGIKRIHVPMSEVAQYLQSAGVSACVIFCCESGAKADATVRFAHSIGYLNTYSVGSIKNL